jgi:uncharacterized short protein YbdD (DUF466 family)
MTRAAMGVVSAWRACWHALRALSGDDAYDRYRTRHLAAHPDVPLLSRKAFYVDEQRRKWGTINRCC